MADLGSIEPAPAVRLRHVTKRFGDTVAVDDVDLDVADGEFFSMLGPSGSGKTTMLRMIAGFEIPTSGRIDLHGDEVTLRPPYDRDVNTVFQDYALFPHMSVLDNVGYGLMVRKVPKAERRRQAEEALASVQLADLAGRAPAQLSGGQRQRVALARALVNRPSVLLLDEPLGALDLKLREDMQRELKSLQRQVGITFIFVTHDQGEALTMSDRVAVFNGGRIEQVGSPQEIYERPSTPFVAGFVGTSNLLSGERHPALVPVGSTATIRPERITLAHAGDEAGANRPADVVSLAGTVVAIQYLGPTRSIDVDLDGGDRVTVTAVNDGSSTSMSPGDPVQVSFDPDDLTVLHSHLP